MDGNCPVAQVLDLGPVKRHGFTSLCWIPAFPAGMTGIATLLYNGEGHKMRQSVIGCADGEGALFRSLPLSSAPINIPECSQTGSPRHFGTDAEIQAMDGNWPLAQVLDLGSVKRYGFTSLCWIPAFPAGMTGIARLLYKGENSAWQCGHGSSASSDAADAIGSRLFKPNSHAKWFMKAIPSRVRCAYLQGLAMVRTAYPTWIPYFHCNP
jgi:hypothetical protein